MKGEIFLAYPIDIYGLREGDGLTVGDNGNLAALAVAELRIAGVQFLVTGPCNNLVGSHIEVAGKVADGDGDLGRALRGDGEGVGD